MIEELLFRVGIPTYSTTIQVDFAADAANQVNLAQKAPTNIAWIYGISVNVGGVVPNQNAKNLISLADAGSLWIVFKIGSGLIIDTLRLSNMVYMEAGVSRTQDRNYMPVSMPSQLDWQKSFIYNPTPVVSKTVLFNLFYVNEDDYDRLTASGVLGKNGIPPGK